jgi:hypothetical protein
MMPAMTTDKFVRNSEKAAINTAIAVLDMKVQHFKRLDPDAHDDDMMDWAEDRREDLEHYRQVLIDLVESDY